MARLETKTASIGVTRYEETARLRKARSAILLQSTACLANHATPSSVSAPSVETARLRTARSATSARTTESQDPHEKNNASLASNPVSNTHKLLLSFCCV